MTHSLLLLGATLPAMQASGAAASGEVSIGHQAIFLISMLALSVFQLPIQNWLRGQALEDHQTPRPSFQWIDLAAVVVLFYIAQVAIITWLDSRYPDATPETLFESMDAVEALGVTALGFLLPSLYLVAMAFRRPNGPEALGVRGLTKGYRLVYAGITYVAGIPLFLALGILSSLLFSIGSDGAPEQEVAVMIREALPERPIPILLFAVVIVPLMEEILFRGFLLELVASRLGAVAGVLVSSVAFAVLHGKAAALPIFGLAIILGLVKVRTRSLGAAWFVHAIHNGGTTFLLWLSTLLPK